ncbi:hypothetical protein DITRI_Ditri16bG0065200 [Diplodiscus trichospermus]
MEYEFYLDKYLLSNVVDHSINCFHLGKIFSQFGTTLYVQIGVPNFFNIAWDFGLALFYHLIIEHGLNLTKCCREFSIGDVADGYVKDHRIDAWLMRFSVGKLGILTGGAYSKNLFLVLAVGGPKLWVAKACKTHVMLVDTSDYILMGYQQLQGWSMKELSHTQNKESEVSVSKEQATEEFKLCDKRAHSKSALVYGQLKEFLGAYASADFIGLVAIKHFLDAAEQDVLFLADSMFFSTQTC